MRRRSSKSIPIFCTDRVVRPSDWYFGASVQQQLLPRVALDIGYNRRWFNGFFVTDNLNVGPADFDAYTLTAPLHPDLPDGGGYPFTALNIKPEKFTQLAQNYLTFASDYGSQTAVLARHRRQHQRTAAQ